MGETDSDLEKQKEAQPLLLQKAHSTIAQTVPLGEKPMTGIINMAQMQEQPMMKPLHNNLKNKGRIEMIIGPMFAGKSTELLRRMRRYEIA